MSSIPPTICTLIHCDKPRYKSGFCDGHYSKVIAYGNTRKGAISLLHTDEYRIWSGMKSRCLNPKHRAYDKYGGHGIKVCERWADPIDGFENFILDMDWKPQEDSSVDRKYNDGDYTPDNCRWATKIEQAANRRRHAKSTSGYMGVYIDRAAPDKWYASFEHKGKVYRLGRFRDVEEAALQYDRGVIFFRGYGTTNFL